MKIELEFTEDEKIYRVCGCGVGCAYLETGGEPCWGSVCAVDEVDDGQGEWIWIHACAGHLEVFDGGKYEPRPYLKRRK